MAFHLTRRIAVLARGLLWVPRLSLSGEAVSALAR